MNTYGYVGGNPLKWIDPTGQALQGVVIGGGVRIVGGRAASGAVGGWLRLKLGQTAGGIIACVTVFECSSSHDEPPGVGSWEDDLDWVQNGPKDETYQCNNDDDEHCKKRLKLLRTLYSLIWVRKNTGINTILEEVSYNSMANAYHEDCPYWVKVPTFNTPNSANE